MKENIRIPQSLVNFILMFWGRLMGPFVSVQEKKLCPKIFRLLLTVIAPVRGVAGEGGRGEGGGGVVAKIMKWNCLRSTDIWDRLIAGWITSPRQTNEDARVNSCRQNFPSQVQLIHEIHGPALTPRPHPEEILTKKKKNVKIIRTKTSQAFLHWTMNEMRLEPDGYDTMWCVDNHSISSLCLLQLLREPSWPILFPRKGLGVNMQNDVSATPVFPSALTSPHSCRTH